MHCTLDELLFISEVHARCIVPGLLGPLACSVPGKKNVFGKKCPESVPDIVFRTDLSPAAENKSIRSTNNSGALAELFSTGHASQKEHLPKSELRNSKFRM